MTLSEFIKLISEKIQNEAEIRYIHPSLFIIVIDDSFEKMDENERRQKFIRALEIKSEYLERIECNSLVEIRLVTKEERQTDYSYIDEADSGKHWLGAFNPVGNSSTLTVSENPVGLGIPKALHFYGYKGGQARSTVLLAFSKMLADANYRVLIVDADVEAPSLDTMLETSATDVRSTLMGVCESNDVITPITRAYVGRSNTGQVDVIACRPISSSFDMDFAAFLLSSSLDPKMLENGVRRLREFSAQEPVDGSRKYDLVLFDHRTGLAPSVLPIMQAWPGAAVIFIRPDGMARHIIDSKLIDLLLGHDPDAPGAFVSFSLKSKQLQQEVRNNHAKFIDKLLEKISDVITTSNGSDEGEDIDPAELERYWVYWKHDDGLADGKQPSPSDLSLENRAALSQLRSVLGLSGAPSVLPNHSLKLTSSGSSDEGQFILTPDIAKIFSIDSPYTYIFGRKGTGKTRLLSELCRQKLGEPLLVASDSNEGGLQSSGPLFQQVLEYCDRNFELFWWFLLNVALKCGSMGGVNFSDALKAELAISGRDLVLAEIITNVEIQALSTSKLRVFLVDGIETAVPSANLRAFVESVFRFLSAVQFNRVLSSAVTIRLFLRLDLARGSTQNIEQQIEGHLLQLHWKKTAILNFALARIISLQWFKDNFSEVCKEINSKIDLISLGNLDDDSSETLLLKIFPLGLERNKVKTTTFFSTYFSDAGGDSERNATFYPRLFDGFLKMLAKKCSEEASLEFPDGRLPSRIVLEAYDEASRDFISDVQVELYSFLTIDEDDSRNKDAVNSLIKAFSGLRTPFVTEEIIPDLAKRSSISEEKIRQALRGMQDVGIFEDRPAYPGELRTGRLYKAGLAMKYGRKRDNS
jgi:hypothetical protein